MRKKYLPGERGFTLLEVVFAVGILAIGMMGYTALKVSNRYSWVFARNLTLALNVTTSNLEGLRLAASGLGYHDDPWMSPGDHTEADVNSNGDAPPLTSGYFTAKDVTWKVREGCPTKEAKMVTYTTNWNDAGDSVNPSTKKLTITQVLLRDE
jgi:prepilin-type N-terminal cleavage/methylation domain-containing protein